MTSKLLIDKVLNKEHLYKKNHAENVHQKLIPDPFLILVNNPKQHVLVCHPYVTRMYSYLIRMSLVCGFTMNLSLFPFCFCKFSLHFPVNGIRFPHIFETSSISVEKPDIWIFNFT